jgi:hypothetical protein
MPFAMPKEHLHTKADGTTIPVSQMTNAHLANTIRLLERNSLRPDLSTCEIWVGHDFEDLHPVVESLTPAEYLELVNYEAYIKEAKRRLKKNQGRGPMFFLKDLLRPFPVGSQSSELLED